MTTSPVPLPYPVTTPWPRWSLPDRTLLDAELVRSPAPLECEPPTGRFDPLSDELLTIIVHALVRLPRDASADTLVQLAAQSVAWARALACTCRAFRNAVVLDRPVMHELLARMMPVVPGWAALARAGDAPFLQQVKQEIRAAALVRALQRLSKMLGCHCARPHCGGARLIFGRSERPIGRQYVAQSNLAVHLASMPRPNAVARARPFLSIDDGPGPVMVVRNHVILHSDNRLVCKHISPHGADFATSDAAWVLDVSSSRQFSVSSDASTVSLIDDDGRVTLTHPGRGTRRPLVDSVGAPACVFLVCDERTGAAAGLCVLMLGDLNGPAMNGTLELRRMRLTDTALSRDFLLCFEVAALAVAPDGDAIALVRRGDRTMSTESRFGSMYTLCVIDLGRADARVRPVVPFDAAETGMAGDFGDGPVPTFCADLFSAGLFFHRGRSATLVLPFRLILLFHEPGTGTPYHLSAENPIGQVATGCARSPCGSVTLLFWDAAIVVLRHAAEVGRHRFSFPCRPYIQVVAAGCAPRMAYWVHSCVVFVVCADNSLLKLELA